MQQEAGSKLGKEYIKAVYSHPVYLTSMQGTSCEMPDWMNHKLESRLREKLTTSDMPMIPLMAESKEELKSLLIRYLLKVNHVTIHRGAVDHKRRRLDLARRTRPQRADSPEADPQRRGISVGSDRYRCQFNSSLDSKCHPKDPSNAKRCLSHKILLFDDYDRLHHDGS